MRLTFSRSAAMTVYQNCKWDRLKDILPIIRIKVPARSPFSATHGPENGDGVCECDATYM